MTITNERLLEMQEIYKFTEVTVSEGYNDIEFEVVMPDREVYYVNLGLYAITHESENADGFITSETEYRVEEIGLYNEEGDEINLSSKQEQTFDNLIPNFVF